MHFCVSYPIVELHGYRRREEGRQHDSAKRAGSNKSRTIATIRWKCVISELINRRPIGWIRRGRMRSRRRRKGCFLSSYGEALLAKMWFNVSSVISLGLLWHRKLQVWWTERITELSYLWPRMRFIDRFETHCQFIHIRTYFDLCYY